MPTDAEHPHVVPSSTPSQDELGNSGAGSADWAAGVDPRRMLVFRAVGREGSFAAAARVLGWTQPAVSQHVHRLERDVGMPLVARVGRGIRLTNPGRVLLAHAENVAAALAGADRAVSSLSGLHSGSVRIAAFPSASATLVAPAIGTLADQHPDIDVHLTQLEPPEAEKLLLHGDCDLALVFDYTETGNTPGAFDSTPLLDDPLRVVLPPGHALRDATRVALADLRHDRWVAGCPRCRQHLISSAAEAGFTPLISHSTDDYVVVQTLVATGTAVAILPALALAATLNAAVHPRAIADHPPRRVRALTLPGADGVPAIAAVLAHLRKAARSFASATVSP